MSSLKFNYKLEKKYINAKVVGHYSLTKSEKTCPNFNVEKWYKTIGVINSHYSINNTHANLYESRNKLSYVETKHYLVKYF